MTMRSLNCYKCGEIVLCARYSEQWQSKFNGLLSFAKGCILDMWEIRKHKI